MNKLDDSLKEELKRLEAEQDVEAIRDVLGIVGVPDCTPKTPIPPPRNDLYLDDPEDC
jgi:hypothetical protein